MSIEVNSSMEDLFTDIFGADATEQLNTPSEVIEYNYHYLDICRTKETVTYRHVPDNNGQVIKVLRGVRQGSITINDESTGKPKTSRIRICDPSNFSNLEPSQLKLIEELNTEMDKYKQLSGSWEFKLIKRITIFYGILISKGLEKFNKYKVSLFDATSFNFLGEYKQFIEQYSQLYPTFDKDYFSKDNQFNKVFTLVTKRPEIAYVSKFNTKELETPIDITEEVYSQASNLDMEYIDTVNFMDELYYNFLLDIRKCNEQLSKNNQNTGK